MKVKVRIGGLGEGLPEQGTFACSNDTETDEDVVVEGRKVTSADC